MGNTSSSKWIIIGVLYIIEFALVFLSNGNLALIALVCAIVGWRAITVVQPGMFVWMPFAGWIIYLVVKFIIAYFVGLFITPYTIGNRIADALSKKG